MKIALIALDHQHGKLEHVLYGLEFYQHGKQDFTFHCVCTHAVKLASLQNMMAINYSLISSKNFISICYLY